MIRGSEAMKPMKIIVVQMNLASISHGLNNTLFIIADEVVELILSAGGVVSYIGALKQTTARVERRGLS
jgi:hypothetical protein